MTLVIRSFDFPLVPGKKWTFRYSRFRRHSGRHAWGHAEAEVIGPVPQPVETAAGKFNVIEIQRTDFLHPVAALTYFYSPKTKSVVKLTADIIRSGGRSGPHFELELIKYGHKDPVVQAPVYDEGDWWVFRVSVEPGFDGDVGKVYDERPEYRVTYKNGRFESDYPGFLTQADNPDDPSYFPFASVNINDPCDKELRFSACAWEEVDFSLF